jgi:membrane protein YdbS with pleckstrin-like domain
MIVKERGIELLRSRRSFFYNYILLILVLMLFALVWVEFDLTFALIPRSQSEFQKSFVVLGFVMLIGFLIEEPTIYRIFCNYTITNNEVVKTEGIIRKKKSVIPYQTVANVSVYKSVTGRIFNFGDIEILGFRDKIEMKGIYDPEVYYRIINNKIAVMRGTAPKAAGIEKDVGTEKVISTDWRKKQKELEKIVEPVKTIEPRRARRRDKSDIFGLLRSFRPVEEKETGKAGEGGTEITEETGETTEEIMEQEHSKERPQGKKRKREKRKRKPKGKRR